MRRAGTICAILVTLAVPGALPALAAKAAPPKGPVLSGVIKALTPGKGNPNPPYQIWKKYREAELLPVMLQAVEDPAVLGNPESLHNAYTTLAMIGPGDDEPTHADSAQLAAFVRGLSHEDNTVREICRAALGSVDILALPEFFRLLDAFIAGQAGGGDEPRLLAFRMLCQTSGFIDGGLPVLRDPVQLAVIARGLGDSDPQIRQLCAATLRSAPVNLLPESCLDALRAEAGDEDPQVSSAARETLAVLLPPPRPPAIAVTRPDPLPVERIRSIGTKAGGGKRWLALRLVKATGGDPQPAWGVQAALFPEGQPKQEAVSDSNGLIVFAAKPGQVSLEIDDPRYEPRRETLTLNARSKDRVALMPTAELSVRVVLDEWKRARKGAHPQILQRTRSPFRGEAEVTVHGSAGQPPREKRLDPCAAARPDCGEAVFYHLAAGDYVVSVASGEWSAERTVHVLSATPASVELALERIEPPLSEADLAALEGEEHKTYQGAGKHE